MFPVLFLLISAVGCFQVDLDVDKQECFHELLAPNSKLSIMFEVTSGGFLEANFALYDPENQTLYEKSSTSTGRLTISAHSVGIYRFCFTNQLVSKTFKTIVFHVFVQQATTTSTSNQLIDDEQLASELRIQIDTLGRMLTMIDLQSEMQAQKIRGLNLLSEYTNKIVTRWAVMEMLIALGMLTSQVLYIRKLFEVRCAI